MNGGPHRDVLTVRTEPNYSAKCALTPTWKWMVVLSKYRRTACLQLRKSLTASKASPVHIQDLDPLKKTVGTVPRLQKKMGTRRGRDDQPEDAILAITVRGARPAMVVPPGG